MILTWYDITQIENELQKRKFTTNHLVEVECVNSIIEAAFDYWLVQWAIKNE